MNESIHGKLDWGSLTPLKIRARHVADGLFVGAHRSQRRGAGVEFGGHRAYVPGDDLRWLDRHALMRHGRLVIREFETETDRALCLLLDASPSMGFKSERAPGAKLAYAALLAAALGRVAVAGGDPISLDWLAGDDCHPLPGTGGRHAFERLVAFLEEARAGGSLGDPKSLEHALASVDRRASRGAVIVILSDLIDLPKEAPDAFAALATRRRTVNIVQVLDPEEAEFPFDGAVQLRGIETGNVVETDALTARQGYLAALGALTASFEDRLVPRGGRVVRAKTSDDPTAVLRALLTAMRGGMP